VDTLRTHCGHIADTADKIADTVVLTYVRIIFESCMIKYIYSYLRTYIRNYYGGIGTNL
jgi:hypothetical protein